MIFGTDAIRPYNTFIGYLVKCIFREIGMGESQWVTWRE